MMVYIFLHYVTWWERLDALDGNYVMEPGDESDQVESGDESLEICNTADYKAAVNSGLGVGCPVRRHEPLSPDLASGSRHLSRTSSRRRSHAHIPTPAAPTNHSSLASSGLCWSELER